MAQEGIARPVARIVSPDLYTYGAMLIGGILRDAGVDVTLSRSTGPGRNGYSYFRSIPRSTSWTGGSARLSGSINSTAVSATLEGRCRRHLAWCWVNSVSTLL